MKEGIPYFHGDKERLISSTHFLTSSIIKSSLAANVKFLPLNYMVKGADGPFSIQLSHQLQLFVGWLLRLRLHSLSSLSMTLSTPRQIKAQSVLLLTFFPLMSHPQGVFSNYNKIFIIIIQSVYFLFG